MNERLSDWRQQKIRAQQDRQHQPIPNMLVSSVLVYDRTSGEHISYDEGRRRGLISRLGFYTHGAAYAAER